jgi:hypothetical protein
MNRYIFISALLAVAQARFGQERGPIAKIEAVQGGDPGMTTPSCFILEASH